MNNYKANIECFELHSHNNNNSVIYSSRISLVCVFNFTKLKIAFIFMKFFIAE